MKIVFTGGGSGGHLFPLISIIREFKKVAVQKGEKIEREVILSLYYLGPVDKFSKELFEKEGVKVVNIISGKIRRYLTPLSLFQNFFDILIKIPLGIIQSFFWLFLKAPDLVFSKGGPGSLPVILSSWLLQIPLFIHESDAIPGLNNRMAAKFAQEIFISFQETEGFPKDKIFLVGNPIRNELLQGSLEEGKRLFNINMERPVILILGGSQGATRINDLIINILPEWLQEFDLIHQVGRENEENIKKEVELLLSPELRKHYRIFGFLDEDYLKHALKIAHLIIARAGSGTIFEIAAAGKASILIPLPEAAQNHQLKNASILAKNKAAIMIEQANSTPHFLLETAKNLLGDPEKLKTLALNALEFAKPKAARIIAEYLFAYLTT